MALHYNLSKVHAISENDTAFVKEIVRLFVIELPTDLQQLKNGISEKDHSLAYSFAHKIKPSLDLLGLTIAFEEMIQIEEWTYSKGKKKEIIETFKSVSSQIEKAIKEIKKDFNLR